MKRLLFLILFFNFIWTYSNSQGIYNPAILVSRPMCENGGFESTTSMLNWVAVNGMYLNGTSYSLSNINNIGFVSTVHHAITSNTWGSFDPIVKSLRKINSGSHSLKLGSFDPGSNGKGQLVSRTFTIAQANTKVSFWYAVVMADPLHPAHVSRVENNAFRVRVRNQFGTVFPGLTDLGGGAIDIIDGYAGSSLTPDPLLLRDPSSGFKYRNWTCAEINLSGFAVGSRITVEFITHDCARGGGDMTYAYIDDFCMSCSAVSNGTCCNKIDSSIYATDWDNVNDKPIGEKINNGDIITVRCPKNPITICSYFKCKSDTCTVYVRDSTINPNGFIETGPAYDIWDYRTCYGVTSSTQTGLWKFKRNYYCGDTTKPCDSFNTFVNILPCIDTPKNCCGTSPGTVNFYNNSTGTWTTYPSTLTRTFNLSCEGFPGSSFNFKYNCNLNCDNFNATYKNFLYGPSGNIVAQSNQSTFGPFVYGTNGRYTVKSYFYCADSNKICDSSITYLDYHCIITRDTCCGSWDSIEYEDRNKTNSKRRINCNDTLNVHCKSDSNFIYWHYRCKSSERCGVTYESILWDPKRNQVGTISGNNPFGSIKFNSAGVWKAITYVHCGVNKCDSCVIYFRVTCDTPPPCCDNDKLNIAISENNGLNYSTLCGANINVGLNTNVTLTYNPFRCKSYSDTCGVSYAHYLISPKGLPIGTNISGGGFGSNLSTSFIIDKCGLWRSVSYVYCGGSFIPCDSCVYYFRVACDTPPPCCDNDKLNIAISENNGLSYSTFCGTNINVGLNTTVTLTYNPYRCKSYSDTCGVSYAHYLTDPDNLSIGTNISGGGFGLNLSTSFKIDKCGIWRSVSYVYCGGSFIPCDSCEYFFKVKCDSIIDSCCLGWNYIDLYNNTTKDLTRVVRNSRLTVDCESKLAFNYSYNCSNKCDGYINAKLFDEFGVGSTYNPGEEINIPNMCKGTYRLQLLAYCGNKMCDSTNIFLDYYCDSCTTCNDTCDWHTNGNANIQAYNFIGPRNAADFKIRTNNAERMTVEANGNVGIGTVTPGNRLELNDNRTNTNRSGLRLTELNMSNRTNILPISNTVLSVDNNGDVILVNTIGGKDTGSCICPLDTGLFWRLGGNFNPNPNYIGTNSNHDFNIHTNAGSTGLNRRAQYTEDGNYDFGTNNRITNSIVSAVNGRFNRTNNSTSSYSFGDTNTIDSSKFIGTLGRNNTIYNSDRVMAFGGRNTINMSNQSTVLGEDLTLNRGHGCFVAGGHSTVNSGIFGYHISLGKYCDIDGGFNSVNNYDINIGSYNLIRESGKSSIIGDSSSILNSLRSYSYGNYNNIVSGNNSFVFGSKIGSFAANSMRFGFNNNRTMTLTERGISIQVNPGDGSPSNLPSHNLEVESNNNPEIQFKHLPLGFDTMDLVVVEPTTHELYRIPNPLGAFGNVNSSCTTKGFIPMVATSGSPNLSCSNIYDDGLRVGILTTIPTHDFHVNGQARVTNMPAKQIEDAIVFAARQSNPNTEGELRELPITGNSNQYLGGDGTWQNLPSIGGGSGWALNGNSGTTASSISGINVAANNNFIGTKDSQDFVIATNNLERMRISTKGRIRMNNTAGSSSLFIAGGNETTNAGYNTAIGFSSMSIIGVGEENTSLGYQSLQSITTGGRNTAIGMNAMRQVTSGVQNIGIGYNSLINMLSGSDNVGIGTSSLSSCISCSSNFGLGFQSLMRVTTGTGNIGIGNTAGSLITLGSDNIAIGTNTALNGLKASSFWNVAIGGSAANNLDGFGNVAIGHLAATPGGLSTSTNSIFIGFSSRALNTISSNEIVIGANAMGYGSNTATYGHRTDMVSHHFPSGNVGIGTNNFSLTGASNIGGSTGSTAKLATNGLVLASGYYANSDENLKKDIQLITNANSIISKLDGRSYLWTKEYQNEAKVDNNRHYGFIAQELAEVLPEAVVKDNNGRYAVEYNALLPILVESQKSILEDNKTLKSRNEELESKVASLQEKFALLEKSLAVLCESGCVGLEKLGAKTNSDVDALYQSIPNPTDDIALINYFLTKVYTNASIIVSTQDGKQIQSFNLEPKTGNGSVKVSLGTLASGTYLYTLVAGERVVDTKRLQIVK